MTSEQTSSNIKCCNCGHDVFREHLRLNNAATIVLPLVLIALCVGLLRGALWWTSGSIALGGALMLLRWFGGVWYWGGLRCTRCGHVSMYR